MTAAATPQALTLDIGGFELAALAWGEPDAQPVLAAHGWLDNAASMSGLAPRLCAANELRIVSLDLPGHGLSQHKQGHYHFVDWVADVVAAADALGWERFSLLGHSMGAGISTLVAGTVPKRIERCILLDGIGPMSDEPKLAAKRLARSLRVETRKRDSAKRLFESPEAARARLLQATKMEPSSAARLIERGMVQLDEGWSWRADPKLRIDSRARLSEEAVYAFLKEISCPVLMILAEQGWPRNFELMRKRTDAVADITVVEVPGRHHVHLDDPEQVAAKIEAWLQR